jgi:hypothetical protein
MQGHDCSQSAVPDRILLRQISALFDVFTLAEGNHIRQFAPFSSEQQGVEQQVVSEPDIAVQRARIEARLERQQQLYEFGDWSRERYLRGREELLAELEELDSLKALQLPERQIDVLTRLGTAIRQLSVAWQKADRGDRRRLLRSLFEQLWVVGDEIVAVKPVGQFAPFFHMLYRAQGSGREGWHGAVDEEGARLLAQGAHTQRIARDTAERHGGVRTG